VEEDDLSSISSADSADLEAALASASDDDEEGDELEEIYAAKAVAKKLKEANQLKKARAAAGSATTAATGKKRSAPVDEDGSSGEEEDEEEDHALDLDDLFEKNKLPRNVALPSTGKVAAPAKEKKVKKEKVKRQDESPEERDSRTLFIGNVPSLCSTSRVRLPPLFLLLLTLTRIAPYGSQRKKL